MHAAMQPAAVGRVEAAGAILFQRLSITFRVEGGSGYTAVKGVDLAVADGEFVAIVGPTGCGKSTLLNVAAGLIVPSSGNCHIFGEPLSGLNRQAGYLFQAEALMPWKTALENVAVGLEIRGQGRREARRQAAEWLGRVGLKSFLDRYPHQLSGGQRKRVALAQVLLLDPKLLLMDEPFGPLDAQTRQIMGELLLDLWSADRKAVLFITHDLEEAIALADRVVIMSAGPASTFIGDYSVPLRRPRDPAAVRHTPEFADIHRLIWNQLRDEVMKAYRHGDQG
jgi:NitT/TauT family transport system ATP-binding protein